MQDDATLRPPAVSINNPNTSVLNLSSWLLTEHFCHKLVCYQCCKRPALTVGASVRLHWLGLMAAYARAVAKIAAAQIAEAAGYEGIQASANDTLAELMLRYSVELGSAAHSYAELAGRTVFNAADLELALDDMGVSVEELVRYVRAEEEVPFPQPLAHFPVVKRPSLAPSFADKQEEAPPHVPAWLPAFPDKHTYVATPAFAAHDKDARRQRAAANKARREAEQALQKEGDLAIGRGVPGETAGDVRDGIAAAPVEARGGPEVGPVANPFLAAPLWEERGGPGCGPAIPGWGTGAGAIPLPAPTADAFRCALDAADAGGGGAAPSGSSLVWQEVDELEAPAGPPLAPVAPFPLSWPAATRARALACASHLGFEDAYAAARDAGAADGGLSAADARGRKRKGSKARSTADPAAARAEAILAGGGTPAGAAQAMAEDD
ncbi:hypothetical protein WJX81_001347 [Elliptochloris bilobata]|uniref:Transcription initiation factor TFIID subunit 8 n=1 Tax=Elliptochloris bilobata TaxID=381761 RepID=A0AAW1QLT3_9CHLO